MSWQWPGYPHHPPWWWGLYGGYTIPVKAPPPTPPTLPTPANAESSSPPKANLPPPKCKAPPQRFPPSTETKAPPPTPQLLPKAKPPPPIREIPHSTAGTGEAAFALWYTREDMKANLKDWPTGEIYNRKNALDVGMWLHFGKYATFKGAEVHMKFGGSAVDSALIPAELDDEDIRSAMAWKWWESQGASHMAMTGLYPMARIYISDEWGCSDRDLLADWV